jgi:hypothetical protein
MKQRRSSIFVDATYRCVPVQFYQLVIVMLYDTISDLYLPVWYILATGKTAQVYDHVFNSLFIARGNWTWPTLSAILSLR